MTSSETKESPAGRAHVLLALAVAALWLPVTPAAAQSSPKAALTIAPVAPPRAFTFTPRAAFEISFTDNVLLTQTNRKSDVIFSPTVGFTLKDQTAKTTITADSDISYDKYKSTPRLDGSRATGQIAAKIDVIDRLFDIDARVATDQQRINPLGGAPASPRAFGANQSQVINYGATPTLQWRAGNIVKIKTQYDIALVNYVQTGGSSATVPASDSVQQTVRLNLDSGSYFDILTWTADGYIQRMDRQGPAGAFNRRQAEGSLLYAVVPNMQFVATGGYDDIRDPSLGSGIGGIHATGGLRWAVSPRTKVTLDAGVRYRDPYYNALITYGLGRAVALRASYSVTVETPQSLANLNLSGLTRDPLGNLINPNTGLPGDPNDSPFGLNDQVFRRKIFEIGITGNLGRNIYTLSGSRERRVSSISATNNLSGSAGITRQISPDLRGAATVSYERLTSALAGQNSNTLQGNGQLSYALGKNVDAVASYYYRRTHSSITRVRENAAVLKLTRKF